MKFSVINTLVALVLVSSLPLVASALPVQDEKEKQKSSVQKVAATQEADSKVAQAAEQQDEQELEGEAEDLPEAVVASANSPEMLKQSLDNELDRLKNEFDLKNESIKQIRESLKDELKAAQKRLQSASVMMGSFRLDDEFQKQVWDAVEPLLNGDQKVRLSELRSQANRLRALIDTYAQHAIMMRLDSVLSLTAKQDVALSEVVKSNWKREWNDNSLELAFSGMDGAGEILDGIGREKLRKHLTPEQVKVFKEIDSYSVDFNQIIGSGKVIDTEKLKSLCSSLMKLRLAEVSETCSLDPGQVKRLSIASKGAVSKFAARWEATMTDVTDNPMAAVMNMDVIKMTMEPVVSQCTAESAWSKTLKKVMNGDQMKLLNQRQADRETNAKSIVIGYMSLTFLRDMSGVTLGYDRFLALAEMLDRNIEVKDGQIIDAAFQFFRVPDEEFEKVLTADEWAMLSPHIMEQRQQFEEMEKASEDAKKDDGDEH